QVQEGFTLSLEESRPERADQPQAQLVFGHRRQAVAEKLCVEADLERVAVVPDRQGLSRFADVLGLRRDGELALREAKPERRLSLCHQRRPSNNVEDLLSVQLDLRLKGLRHELAVI